MLCGVCNLETTEGAAYCTHCGSRLEGQEERAADPQAQDAPPYRAPGDSGRFQEVVPQETPLHTQQGSYREDPFQASAPFTSGPAADVKYGGFWMRFVGEIIDWAILLIPSALIALVFVNASFLISAAYFIPFWIIWGATPGKRLMGLRIQRPDGSLMGPGRSVARYFASGLSFLLLGLGFIMIGLREDKRGLHDLICDTVVVTTEQASPSEIVNEFWNKVQGVGR